MLALEFIRRYFVEYGYSPSYGEIGASLRISTQCVSVIVQELAREGEVLHEPRKARSIRLPGAGDELSDSEVLLLLRRRGWKIDPETTEDVLRRIVPPAGEMPEMAALELVE